MAEAGPSQMDPHREAGDLSPTQTTESHADMVRLRSLPTITMFTDMIVSDNAAARDDVKMFS